MSNTGEDVLDIGSVLDLERGVIDRDISSQGYAIKRNLDATTLAHYQNDTGYIVNRHRKEEHYIAYRMDDTPNYKGTDVFAFIDAESGSEVVRRYNQAVDRISITAEERWKTSELSGDEWRYNGLIEFFHKGKMVHSNWRGTAFDQSLRWPSDSLPTQLRRYENSQLDAEELARREPLCDQLGCTEQGELYRMEHHEADLAGNFLPKDGKIHVTRFCKRHRNRGTCAIVDRSDNYTLFPQGEQRGRSKTPEKSKDARDESPKRV